MLRLKQVPKGGQLMAGSARGRLAWPPLFETLVARARRIAGEVRCRAFCKQRLQKQQRSACRTMPGRKFLGRVQAEDAALALRNQRRFPCDLGRLQAVGSWIQG